MYQVHGINPAYTLTALPSIIFQSEHNLPAPDPRYIALHAACAKAAYMSGVTIQLEYRETIHYREIIESILNRR